MDDLLNKALDGLIDHDAQDTAEKKSDEKEDDDKGVVAKDRDDKNSDERGRCKS